MQLNDSILTTLELDTLNTDPYAQDQEGMQLNDSILTTMELDTLNTDPYAQDQEGMQLNDLVLTATFTKRRRGMKLLSMIQTCFRCDNQKP